MRDDTRLFLDRRIGRRAFVSRLVGLGVSASAATAFAERLEAQGVAPGRAVPPSRILTDQTGGELLAEFLLEWNVPYVFGLGGSEEVGFLDALVDRTRLQYVLGLHEASVMSMADGYARAAGTPAFVNLHSIAGAGHALGPLVNSCKDRTPIVVTVGRQSTNLRGQEGFLEAANLHMVPRDYTRWTWDVLRSDTIPDVARRAFLFASAPPGGPTFVTVSKDLWETRVPRAEILPRARSEVDTAFEPSREAVSRAVGLLRHAQNPFIVAGRELSMYGGISEMAEIAALLGSAVFCDIPDSHAPLSFDTTHPQYAGLFTMDPETPGTMDLFWAVGGTMFTQMAASRVPLVPRNVPVIHTGMSAAELGRNYPVDVPMLASVRSALRAILEELRRTPPPGDVVEARRKAVQAHSAARRARLARAAEAVWNDRPISNERLFVETNRRIDPDAIVVGELASSDLFLWNHLDFNQDGRGRLHLTSSGGCLGWGIGAAIGAKIARPERPVVLLVGDGSYQFGVQALWTAARYEVPIAIVIVNNREYQANRRNLHRYGGRAAATGKYVGASLVAPDIDHVGLARAYGIEGERVEDPDDLGAALDRCLRTAADGRAFVLDVLVQRVFDGARSTWFDSFSVAKGQPRQS